VPEKGQRDQPRTIMAGSRYPLSLEVADRRDPRPRTSRRPVRGPWVRACSPLRGTAAQGRGFTAGTCARMGTVPAACRLTTGDVFRGTGEPSRATASLRWVWARPAWAGRYVHQRFAVAGYGSWRQHED
jgi:hypothetical protein